MSILTANTEKSAQLTKKPKSQKAKIKEGGTNMKYLIEKTKCFEIHDIRKNSKGVYTNFFGVPIHTASFRIAWLLTCELLDTLNINEREIACKLYDIMEQLEKTNGGRFEK